MTSTNDTTVNQSLLWGQYIVTGGSVFSEVRTMVNHDDGAEDYDARRWTVALDLLDPATGETTRDYSAHCATQKAGYARLHQLTAAYGPVDAPKVPANQPEIDWHETKCQLVAVVKEIRAQIFAVQRTLGWSDHNKLCGALNEIEHAIRGNWLSAARHEATIAEFAGADLARQYERALYALVCHEDKLPTVRAQVDAALEAEKAAPGQPAPAAVDTGRAHGPSIVDLLAGRDGLQLPTPAEASAWWAEMGRRNPWTTPAAVAAVPQTVIAENERYQLLAEDGAAFLAAHDRTQAARTLTNRLTVKPSPAGTCFNVYDGRDKIANLARYQTFNNRWFYDAHGCPDGGFATSTEAVEHLAARHFAQPAHTHDISRPATLPQLMACPACCAPQPGDIEWSLD